MEAIQRRLQEQIHNVGIDPAIDAVLESHRMEELAQEVLASRGKKAGMKRHRLKTQADPFTDMWIGAKTADFRINDRGYQVEDIVIFREWDHFTRKYTGYRIVAIITHIQEGFGIPKGHVMLSYQPLYYRASKAEGGKRIIPVPFISRSAFRGEP